MSALSDEITYDEFVHRAQQLGLTQPELLAELYPAVKDLLAMAARVGRIAPPLYQDLDPANLSRTATGA